MENYPACKVLDILGNFLLSVMMMYAFKPDSQSECRYFYVFSLVAQCNQRNIYGTCKKNYSFSPVVQEEEMFKNFAAAI